MEFRIDQWAGAKGLGLRTKKYSFTIHPCIIGDFRIRKLYTMRSWREYTLWMYRNRRLDTNDWDRDLVIFGIMIQVQKYKQMYWK
jgi:hypothetical protein